MNVFILQRGRKVRKSKRRRNFIAGVISFVTAIPNQAIGNQPPINKFTIWSNQKFQIFLRKNYRTLSFRKSGWAIGELYNKNYLDYLALQNYVWILSIKLLHMLSLKMFISLETEPISYGNILIDPEEFWKVIM